MKCAEAQEAIYGTPNPLLDAHCQSCQECRELRQSWELLGQLPELTPSPLFQARVWEKIRLEERAPAWNFKRWLGGLSLSLAGLAVCLNLSAATPLATPTLPPPVQKELAQNLAAGELQEWDASLDFMPSLDEAVAVDDSPVAVLPLGDLSHDYFAEEPPL